MDHFLLVTMWLINYTTEYTRLFSVGTQSDDVTYITGQTYTKTHKC